jgi:hypothetical protein
VAAQPWPSYLLEAGHWADAAMKMLDTLLIGAVLFGAGIMIARAPAVTSVRPAMTAVAAPAIPPDQAKAVQLFEAYETLKQQNWPPKATPGFLGEAEAIAKAQREIDAARNALASYLCTLRSADDWVGKVTNVTEDGSLQIQIGFVYVRDSNMKMPGEFVIKNHSKIEKGSAVYQAMGRLERGATVKFSGKFVVNKACAVPNQSWEATGLTIDFEQVRSL